MMENTCLVDCEAGRRLGCSTFCCRLIVRLTADDTARGVPGVSPPMRCIPKDADGYCVHLDRIANQCRIWESRPQVCRDYDCNSDELLQVVIRHGFKSLTDVVTNWRRTRGGIRILVPRRAGGPPEGNEP